MTWEAKRTNWSEIKAAGSGVAQVPSVIDALAAATDSDQAGRLSSGIEYVVSPNQGLYESALPTIPLLLDALLRATPASRETLLEVLTQIALGVPAYIAGDEAKNSFMERCFAEIGRGMSTLFWILENGTDGEIDWCVLIVVRYANYDPSIRDRAAWYFKNIIARGVDDTFRAYLEDGVTTLSEQKSYPNILDAIRDIKAELEAGRRWSEATP
jgi:hypothetical protein